MYGRIYGSRKLDIRVGNGMDDESLDFLEDFGRD
jgi:hypothetical protein